jgi:hypothetical protein
MFKKDEIKTMQTLLSCPRNEKEASILKVWVEQISSLSYDIEDCLDNSW